MQTLTLTLTGLKDPVFRSHGHDVLTMQPGLKQRFLFQKKGGESVDPSSVNRHMGTLFRHCGYRSKEDMKDASCKRPFFTTHSMRSGYLNHGVAYAYASGRMGENMRFILHKRWKKKSKSVEVYYKGPMNRAIVPFRLQGTHGRQNGVSQGFFDTLSPHDRREVLRAFPSSVGAPDPEVATTTCASSDSSSDATVEADEGDDELSNEMTEECVMLHSVVSSIASSAINLQSINNIREAHSRKLANLVEPTWSSKQLDETRKDSIRHMIRVHLSRSFASFDQLSMHARSIVLRCVVPLIIDELPVNVVFLRCDTDMDCLHEFVVTTLAQLPLQQKLTMDWLHRYISQAIASNRDNVSDVITKMRSNTYDANKAPSSNPPRNGCLSRQLGPGRRVSWTVEETNKLIEFVSNLTYRYMGVYIDAAKAVGTHRSAQNCRDRLRTFGLYKAYLALPFYRRI